MGTLTIFAQALGSYLDVAPDIPDFPQYVQASSFFLLLLNKIRQLNFQSPAINTKLGVHVLPFPRLTGCDVEKVG
jgi:hypothetical protein